MSKKIIAVIAVVTIVFVSVFASCNKKDDDGVYAKNDDFNLVTNENGEKVLNDDGELLVYATDEDGDLIKNDKGEYETLAQQFQPIEDDGVIEDYGFKLTLPEGWKTTQQFGDFENAEKNQTAEVSIVKSTYEDYYKQSKAFYGRLSDQALEADASWEEDIQLGEGFNKVCRLTLSNDEFASFTYFFENSNNVYFVLFDGPNSPTVIAESEAFCKAITFKPHTYYPELTSTTQAN